jgi:iterative type I PKS product template protein
MDPLQRIFLMTVYEALEMAGYNPNSSHVNASRISTYFGQSTEDWRNINEQQGIQAHYLPCTNRSFAPGRVNHHFKWGGGYYSIDTSCSSSATAIHLACKSLLARECDMTVVGGGNICVIPEYFSGFSLGSFLSPTGQCKTFSDAADGYCRGEAICTIVLKRVEDAIASNDNILAVIGGTMRNTNAGEGSITYPGAIAQVDLLKNLLTTSSVDPDEIGFVEMHGTGTQAGDTIEMNTMLTVFSRSPTQPLHVGALKACIGHGEAAAGISSLVKAILMLKNDKIPRQPGSIKPNRKFPDFAAAGIRISDGKAGSIPRSHVDGKRKIIVNSFDAAGGNTSILLQDGPIMEPKQLDPRSHHVVVCSARSAESLLSNKERLKIYLQRNQVILANLAYTTTARRIHHLYRDAYVVDSLQQLISQLDDQSILHQPISKSSPPSVMFVFTGQSSQYTSMGKTLYHTCLRFQEKLNVYDGLCTSQGLTSFIGVIRGEITIDSATTVELQLALVALEIALASFLQDLGIVPTAVTGHSIGEYSALCVARVLSVSDVLYLVHHRASLMEKYCTSNSHGMMAISGSVSYVKDLLEESNSQWEVCCHNGPFSTVIGGPVEGVNSLKADPKLKSLNPTLLQVPYAFHTSQMDPILADFEAVASRVQYGHPQIPIVSTAKGAVVNSPGIFNAAYLVRQTRQIVNFIGAMEACEEKGLVHDGSIVIDVGPHPVCIGLVKSYFSSTPITTLHTLKRGCADWKIISDCLASVYKENLPVNWEILHKDYLDCLSNVNLPSYAFQLQDYWTPYARPVVSTESDFANSFSTTFLQKILSISGNKLSATFISKTSEPAFLRTVQGHLVDGVAICPASVFIDIACTAAKVLVGPGNSDQNFEVVDLKMTKPLVVGEQYPNQTILVESTTNAANASVNITIMSVLGDLREKHASCRVTIHESWTPDASEWPRVSKLIQMRASALLVPSEANFSHKMSKELMYKLFDSIVEYSESFRRLEKICISKDFEDGVAELRAASAENEISFTHNPYCVDALVHFAGFLLNGNLEKPREDIHIASCIDRMVILDHFHSTVDPLACYGTIRERVDQSTTVCDVYLYRGSKLVAFASGICFKKISRAFFRTLTSTNPDNTRTKSSSRRRPASNVSSEVTQPSPFAGKGTNLTKTLSQSTQEIPNEQNLYSLLLEIVAKTTGIGINEVRSQRLFQDLGVDSHMGITIIFEFNKTTGLELPAGFFSNSPSLAEAEKELETIMPDPMVSITSGNSVVSEIEAMSFDTVRNFEDLSTGDARSNFRSSHRVNFTQAAMTEPAILDSRRPKACAILLQGKSNSSATPLFLVAESSGSVSVYTHFPPLPHGRRSYGLESPFSQCPQNNIITVPQLAKCYIDAMKEIQPKGPYLIGGYSFASVYAYEMAYQLALAGEKAMGLLLIDMYVPPPAHIGTKRFSLDGLGDGPLGHVTMRISQLFPKFTENQKLHMTASMREASTYTPIPIPNDKQPDQTHLIWATKGVNENSHAEEHDDSLVGPAWMGVSEKPWEEMSAREMALLLRSWFFCKRETFGPNGWEKLVGENVHVHKVETGKSYKPDLERFKSNFLRGRIAKDNGKIIYLW